MCEEKKEYLWDGETPYFDPSIDQERPSVTPYLLPGEGNGCVIVCPGGGYSYRAPHEGGPIAEMLNANGISAFVLNYRCAPYHHPVELTDALRAIRYVRFNAKRFGIDPEKIGILGFSAGGHLTTTAIEHFDYGCEDGDEIDRVSSRPNAGILCYAVVSLQNHAHIGSRIQLLGGHGDTETVKKLSGECSVRDDMPPVFLWHTAADNAVPVQNSLNMALALKEKNIPFELHVFPDGPHGIGLGKDFPGADQWPALAAGWLHRLGF